MALLRRLLGERAGATGIEYGLIGLLISVAIVGGASLVGNEVLDLYEGVATKVADSHD